VILGRALPWAVSAALSKATAKSRFFGQKYSEMPLENAIKNML